MQDDRLKLLQKTRARMAAVDVPQQILGRALPIGCVAVEITQRCNLDCTLCYLSEHSEQVADVPLEEIYRRLEEAREQYGPYTNVQITGGDPTLRKHDELIQIVAYAHKLQLFPALFTNGIAASRKLLEQLTAVGLCDVAFHVDTTQQRAGFSTEQSLNAIRREYIERARGLDLMVIFNTTVHQDNIEEIPELVRFFAANAGAVGLASFQLQTDTGRGAWGARGTAVTPDGVRGCIEKVARRSLPWDAIRVGHPRCHSYLPTMVIGDTIVPVVEDSAMVGAFIADFAGQHADRREGRATVIWQYLRALGRHPRWLYRGAKFVATHLWQSCRALLRSRGRARKLSFFVQNFMDAQALDQERLDACSFMAMTADGPVSMCEHNASRDDYILKPIKFLRRDGSLGHYEPLTNQARDLEPAHS